MSFNKFKNESMNVDFHNPSRRKGVSGYIV